MIAVAIALLLLAESSSHEAIGLAAPPNGRAPALAHPPARHRRPRDRARAPPCARPACAVHTRRLCPRIPLEGLVLVAVALAPPPHRARIVAAVAGGVLSPRRAHFRQDPQHSLRRHRRPGVQPGVRLGSTAPALGCSATRSAPRHPRSPRSVSVSSCSPPRSLRQRIPHHHAGRPPSPGATVRGLAALTAVWAVCAGLSLQLIPGSPVASTSAVGLAVSQVRTTQAAFRDQGLFEQAIHGSDPEARIPASDLLTGLRGKDVIIAFVESYGQVSIQGAASPQASTPPCAGTTHHWQARAGPRGAPGLTPRATAGPASSPTPRCSRGCG